MDAEDEEGLNMYDAEPVPRWEVVLVDEDKLEGTLSFSALTLRPTGDAQSINPASRKWRPCLSTV